MIPLVFANLNTNSKNKAHDTGEHKLTHILDVIPGAISRLRPGMHFHIGVTISAKPDTCLL